MLGIEKSMEFTRLFTWRTLFPEVCVENLFRNHFDHRPVTRPGLLTGEGLCPFHFQTCWLTYDDYSIVVDNAWGNGMSLLVLIGLETTLCLSIKRCLATYSIEKKTLRNNCNSMLKRGLKEWILFISTCKRLIFRGCTRKFSSGKWFN